MKRQIWITLALAALGSSLILSSSAAQFASAHSRVSAPAATSYTVGSTADTSGLSCNTPLNCTFRSAVEQANLTGNSTIYFSPTVTTIVLGRPITLTANLIDVDGLEAASGYAELAINGNFPALVMASTNDSIYGVHIRSNGSPSGSAQHGVVIEGGVNNDVLDSILSNLGGDGVLVQGGSGAGIENVIIGPTYLTATNCLNHNNGWGILISNAANTSVSNAIIGCNGQDGILITGAGANHNTLQGYSGVNYIGVTNSGGHIPNTLAGVAMVNGAHDNLVTTNVIGGNKTFGVYLGGTGTNTNTVQLNSIGINGTANISNTWDGVMIQAGAQANLIMSNTIQNNAGRGVYITGAGTNYNIVQHNIIRNQGLDGVRVDGGAYGNDVGGFGDRTLGNLISANAGHGVIIADPATNSNYVYGNNIGTNAAGNAVDGNHGSGVVLDNQTHDNQVGIFASERNVIGGNWGVGVSIQNGAVNNLVLYNDIGLNRDFALAQSSSSAAAAPASPSGGGGPFVALPNAGGINVIGSYTNTIGAYFFSSALSNLIFYNTHTGIYVAGAAAHNTIGVNTVSGNGDYGVLLDGGNTAYNTITSTVIDDNHLDGIAERNSAGLNVWSHISLFNNGGLGIDKNAYNDALNVVDVPKVFIDSVAGTVVTGHADPTDGLFTNALVELFRVAPDPSGYGEGKTFVGSTFTDVSGNWTITDNLGGGSWKCYTSFVTESLFVIPYSSSEFSANTCRNFLPLLLKNH